jgi:hypothetical protein
MTRFTPTQRRLAVSCALDHIEAFLAARRSSNDMTRSYSIRPARAPKAKPWRSAHPRCLLSSPYPRHAQLSMLSQLRAGIDVVCPVRRERSGGADAHADAHPSRLTLL